MVDNDRQIELLEEARQGVETAIEAIHLDRSRSSRRTRQHLQIERASLYDFLANDRANRNAAMNEVWTFYVAAREAVRRAACVTDSYFPLDVGLWTRADLLRKCDMTRVQRAEMVSDIYATMDQIDPAVLPPNQYNKFNARRMLVANVIQDRQLEQDEYQFLLNEGSTAGIYLHARKIAPDWDHVTPSFSESNFVTLAKDSADFLLHHYPRIQTDERSLQLLLECVRIAMMKRRPFCGQRQPLPYSDDARAELLKIVRGLNTASAGAAGHVARYMEAVLTWVTDHVVFGR